MRTERCFSSRGLLEVLPIYQLRLVILGVYGSAQGMAIAVHTPAFCGTPVNTLFNDVCQRCLYGGNCTDAISIVNSTVWERFHVVLP
jgi:hypothetical protein